MPFWLGEAPARSDEMSAAVSRLRAAVDAELPGPDEPRSAGRTRAGDRACSKRATTCRARQQSRSPRYLAEAKRSLGVVPTIDTIALERFFDESGGMQLVLHAPFGSRINRAWGLALRKKFCQGFNFELQAAATEEGIILSLGERALVPAGGRVPLPAPEHGARDADAGDPATRRSSRRAGAGAPRSRSQCRATAAARASRTSCSACTPRTCCRRCSPTRSPARTTCQGAREIPGPSARQPGAARCARRGGRRCRVSNTS